MRKLQISAVRNILGLAVIIVLPVACGGGGGGGGGASELALNSLTDLQAGGSLSGGRTTAKNAFDNAASATPRSGSVTQSSTRDTTPAAVTRDTASVGVEQGTSGWSYTLTNTLGSSSWSLSSNGAGVLVDDLSSGDGDFERLSGEDPPGLNAIGDVHGAIMARVTGNELALVFVASNRSSGTDDDYLSIGLWGRITTSPTPMISVGAFADGEEFSYNAESPVGTAEYEGVSLAMYGTAAGEGGLVYGDVELTANFGSNTINGGISNFEAVGIDHDGEFEEPGPINIMLNSANINSQGFFTGDTRLMLDSSASARVREDYNRITDNGSDLIEGKWGGQFFGGAVGSMNQPGLVGGTWGVENDDVYMLGTFAAGHEDRN